MTRRSAGFVNKKPHRKSRSGCFMCKRKKVKCDEARPACGYCASRLLDCQYPQRSQLGSPSSNTYTSPSHETSPFTDPEPLNETDFNDSTSLIPNSLIPAVHAAAGQLSSVELELLDYYKTHTWRCYSIRYDDTSRDLHRQRVPQLGITHSHLLYSLISLAALHRNRLNPSKQFHEQVLIYRQKAFQEYTKELQNITSENYESIIMTGSFLLALVDAPGPHSDDGEYMEWIQTLLKLSEGIRILASLRWSRGIEKLSIYPIICRELRTLPPPPIPVTPGKPALQTKAGPLGATPDHPNPASTYNLPYTIPFAGFVFLPPSLMSLLETMVDPLDEGSIDLNRNALVPVFHTLSPIFLSLYYYHISPDSRVRIFVFTSFLMPDFIALVKAQEPRALLLMAWWFALTDLVTSGVWAGVRVTSVIEVIGRAIRRHGHTQIIESLEEAERISQVYISAGPQKAAESIFDNWEGVNWDEGPKKAEEWELGLLVDLDDDIGFDGLDLGKSV